MIDVFKMTFNFINSTIEMLNVTLQTFLQKETEVSSVAPEFHYSFGSSRYDEYYSKNTSFEQKIVLVLFTALACYAGMVLITKYIRNHGIDEISQVCSLISSRVMDINLMTRSSLNHDHIIMFQNNRISDFLEILSNQNQRMIHQNQRIEEQNDRILLSLEEIAEHNKEILKDVKNDDVLRTCQDVRETLRFGNRILRTQIDAIEGHTERISALLQNTTTTEVQQTIGTSSHSIA